MSSLTTPAFIIISSAPPPHDDIEAAWAERLLWKQLPTEAQRLYCPAKGWHELSQLAGEALRQTALPDEATVLLLTHTQLLLAPRCIEWLASTLDQGASAAIPYDSRRSRKDQPADYLTLRGFERYALQLSAIPPQVVDLDQYTPLCVLTRAGTLRAGQCNRNACLSGQAYLHDFSAYRKGERSDILPLIPTSARRILDVGGGEGRFLAALKKTRCCETHLVETSKAACLTACSHVDKVWQGDFLDLAFDDTFDCICLLDVLEHCIDSIAMLEHAASLLSPHGVIVASIPNVGHWSVISDLLEGRWDYAPAGIHCITHLRFFTRHGIESLFKDAGLSIQQLQPVLLPPPLWFNVSSCENILSLNWESLSSYAYHVVAVPERSQHSR